MKIRLLLIFLVIFLLLPACYPVETYDTPLPTSVEPQSTQVNNFETKTPDPEGMNIHKWESTSPDNEWTARFLRASPKAGSSQSRDYEQLSIYNNEDGRQWTITDAWEDTGLGYTIQQPVKWSKDGQYFYFTDFPVVDGCTAFSPTGENLFRVELETGKSTEILSSSQGIWQVSLSPEEDILVYIDGTSLSLIDMKSGERKNISIDPGEDFEAGNITWSPSGDSIAITLAFKPCSVGYNGVGLFAESSSILVIDPSTAEVKTLVKEDRRRLTTVAWYDSEQIELKDGNEKSWVLNIQTGEILEP